MAAGPQNFDPNIQEYEGIDGFPHQLWDPQTFSWGNDFKRSLGIQIDSEQEEIQTDALNFVVWSKFVLKPRSTDSTLDLAENNKESSPELVQRIMQ